jgi:4-hydroxy-tetrahydrodipicolinate synthase
MSLAKVITVIPTYFNEDNSIDYLSIHLHVKSQYSKGIKSIVLLGTTSEAPTLSMEERLSISNLIFKDFKNHLTVIAGLGGNNTRDMLDELRHLENNCNVIMISQPCYNRPSQEGIYQHYKTLIEATSKDIIIYNIPSRCGINIEPNTIQRISEISDRVVAIKEASGNLDQITQIHELCPNLLLYSGDDALTLPILSIGGFGVISVISNIIPEIIMNIVDQFTNGHIITARNLFYRIRPLIKFCFIESNPVPVKYVLSIINNMPSCAIVRLPLVQLSQESKDKYDGINF